MAQIVAGTHLINQVIHPNQSHRLADLDQAAHHGDGVQGRRFQRLFATGELWRDQRDIGSGLIKVGQPVALVRVDNLIYQVRAGNYLGQNYGRVTKVSETGLSLREIVQDAAGEWIERTATLQLLEGTK